MLGQALLRCVRGLEVTPEKLSLAVMEKTCLEGPGHYLGSDQTLNLMQSEYVYPTIGDRTSPKEWAEVDKPVLVETAQKRLRTILQGPKPDLIPAAVDAAVRDRFASTSAEPEGPTRRHEKGPRRRLARGPCFWWASGLGAISLRSDAQTQRTRCDPAARGRSRGWWLRRTRAHL